MYFFTGTRSPSSFSNVDFQTQVQKENQEKNKQKKTFSPSLLLTWLRVDCMADNFAFFIITQVWSNANIALNET